MPSFQMLQPRTLPQALELLSQHEDLRILAGGTDLVINLRNRLMTPPYVLDIKGIKEMKGVHYDAQTGLRIGALTTLAEIASDPAIRAHYEILAKAANVVAGPNIRNMGTLGGNICLDTRCQWYNQSYFWRKACNFCLKKDGQICHVAPGGSYCWAAYSGDTAPALLTLDASVKLVSPRHERTIALKDFFVMDGIKKYNLERDELLTEILIPAHRADYQGVYKKLRIRDSVDYPLAGAAILARRDQAGHCVDAQVALTAVNPAPVLVEGIAGLLAGQPPSGELFEQAAELARRIAKPMKTSLSTMPYRRHMIGVFVRQGLVETLQANGN
ncbi:MAG: FAD binding domain-containing protein [Acidobacteriota bacterium]